MVVVVDVFVKIFASDVTFDFDRWWSLRFSLALLTVQLCNEKNFWPWCVRYFFGWSCLEWIIHLRGPIFDYDYEDVVLSLPLCSRQLLHRPNSFFSGEDKTNKAVQDFFDGGNSAVVLNIVNCRALFVLPQIWMSQKTLCLQHFFLKGWDEAREIHAYPPGEYNSASFWIIFMKQQHLILDHFHDDCPDEDSIHHHHNPYHGHNFLSQRWGRTLSTESQNSTNLSTLPS